MAMLDVTPPEALERLYHRLDSHLRRQVETGFKEWMFEDAVTEFLHRNFHELFTREVQTDEF